MPGHYKVPRIMGATAWERFILLAKYYQEHKEKWNAKLV